MIQGCPIEVLDTIFEYTAYSDPENAPVNLRSLMLTCSHFRMIAKRHSMRVVCLSKGEDIIAFAGYLKQVVESGDYGNGVLRIKHLGVVGNHRYWGDNKGRSDAEVESENIVPFIISTAAPSLVSLTIFRVKAGYGFDNTRGTPSCKRILHVPDGTIFPMLRDLIALDWGVIRFQPPRDGEFDKRACKLRFPALRRLYYDPHIYEKAVLSALPFLADLRLNILKCMHSDPLTQDEVDHVHSIIIDVPQYRPDMFGGSVDWQDDYDNRISKYQALIDEARNPERSGIVVPVRGSTRYPNRGRILSAWADAVVGGEGCWTKTWIPTILCTGSYDD